MQGEGEGDENRVLARDFYCGDVVERSGALRLGALEKRSDAYDDKDSGGRQQQDLDRGEVPLGSAELVGDVYRRARAGG